MIAALLALTLAAPPTPPPPPPWKPAPWNLPASTQEEAPTVVAGASVAGAVGGVLFAVPAMFALVNGIGLFPSLGIALAIVTAGAAFGGFLGELTAARLATSSEVGGIAAAGALVGTVAGGLAGWSIGAAAFPGTDGTGNLGANLGVLVGGALGGIIGAAGAGGVGAWWLTPAER
ncbi:MAG TPA: hypothetical protein VGO62_06210 [Myxococcota bacterium]